MLRIKRWKYASWKIGFWRLPGGNRRLHFAVGTIDIWWEKR